MLLARFIILSIRIIFTNNNKIFNNNWLSNNNSNFSRIMWERTLILIEFLGRDLINKVCNSNKLKEERRKILLTIRGKWIILNMLKGTTIVILILIIIMCRMCSRLFLCCSLCRIWLILTM